MSDTSSYPQTGSGYGVGEPAALNRLAGQAASQQESADSALAMVPYEYPGGAPPTNPTTQDQHTSTQRLASKQWAGKTSTLNAAQAAQGDADVWVTVPVDRVITDGTSSKVAPVYSSTKGYRSRPGESAGSIPPVPAAGRPY
jgi:hypothetical protein